MSIQVTEQGERAEPAAGLAVRVESVGISFPARQGRVEALRSLSLEIPAGSFTAVIGPNGCGKSTLLRLIAGLLWPGSGSIALDGRRSVAGDGRVGLAFQQPRLVPWLSTLENVALPLALAGAPSDERRQRAIEALRRVGLEDAAALRPAQLSGGMAQRAGLARALITDPPLLLLDEPFSALDLLTREAFDGELERLWLDQPRSVILVTHSVSEAVRMADRIVVMRPRPGSVARVITVDLPRPRPTSPAADAAASAIDAQTRAALAELRPPELAAWVDR